MTDRANSCLVILTKDLRNDDLHEIETALCMIKGVERIVWNVADPSQEYVGRARVQVEVSKALYELGHKVRMDELDD